MLIADFFALFCDLLQRHQTLFFAFGNLQNSNLLVIERFTAPEQIGTNLSSVLWLLPLAMAIAVVYKATKLPTVTAANFIKEAVLLFGSIVVFMTVAALVLCLLAWLITAGGFSSLEL